VHEEVGVVVEDVRVVGSQPWPAGRGGSCELMIGVIAKAATSDIKLNEGEVRCTCLPCSDRLAPHDCQISMHKGSPFCPATRPLPAHCSGDEQYCIETLNWVLCRWMQLRGMTSRHFSRR
jgi:hypothetical protein